MIGTFWNLCRACPAVPSEKGRSEYRSTYQWYEYAAPRQQEVVKNAPQLTSPCGNDDTDIKVGFLPATVQNLADSLYRCKDIDEVDMKSIKPEVNIKKNPIYGNDFDIRNSADENCILPNGASENGVRVRLIQGGNSGIPLKDARGDTEYRLQFAWPQNKNLTDMTDDQKIVRKSLRAERQAERYMVPVHKKHAQDFKKRDGLHIPELEPLVNQHNYGSGEESTTTNGKQEEKEKFYSEYKKNFKPFSQYDYIEGKFQTKKTDSKMDEPDASFKNNWFGEVVELRKKAVEYKHRGWGTELVPEHLAEVYKQIALWEQVSRRSSLSALTLATTVPKPRILSDERGRNYSRKAIPGKAREVFHSTGRQLSADRAPYGTRKFERLEKTTRSAKGFPAKHSWERTNSGTSSSPSTVSSHSVANATSAHYGVKLMNKTTSTEKKKKNLKLNKLSAKIITPTSASTTTFHSKEDVDGKSIGAAKYDYIPVIKTPPEPTKVKSPEQMMGIRSPDPISWIVPLDIGRTFTVTQTIAPSEKMMRFVAQNSGIPTKTVVDGGSTGDAEKPLELINDLASVPEEGEFDNTTAEQAAISDHGSAPSITVSTEDDSPDVTHIKLF